MADLGQAYVQIIPKAEGISGKITDVLSGEAGSAGTKVGGLFSKGFGGKVAKAAAAGGAALATGLTVGSAALKNGIKEAATFGDTVDKMSQKLGLSAESYQKWDYVMNLAGTDMQSMTTGLKTLTNKLDDAKNGSSSAVAMFDKLGISQEKMASMSREELFAATIEGLQGMADTTERAALANDLFGKSGQNLTPLFNQSAEATKEAMKVAEDYGMVMSEDAVKASAAFVDSTTTIQMTLTGLKNRMSSEFLPAATKVTDGLAKMFTGDMSGLDDVVAGIEGITAKVAELAPKLLKAGADLIGRLIDGLMSKSGDIGEKAGQLATTIVSKLIAKAPDILKAGGKLILGLARGLLAGLPKIISTVAKIGAQIVRGLGSALWGKVKAAAEGIKERFLAPIESARDKVKGILDRIKGFFPLHIGNIFSGIRLPHFSVSGGQAPFGIGGKGSLPHFSVSWHKKAEAAPYMFKGATLFGAGEAGDEVLYGRKALMKDIAAATGGNGNGPQITNNITINGASDPMETADVIVRQMKLELRTI